MVTRLQRAGYTHEGQIHPHYRHLPPLRTSSRGLSGPGNGENPNKCGETCSEKVHRELRLQTYRAYQSIVILSPDFQRELYSEAVAAG